MVEDEKIFKPLTTGPDGITSVAATTLKHLKRTSQPPRHGAAELTAGPDGITSVAKTPTPRGGKTGK